MQVRCTVQSPALVLLDNHESHLSLEVLDYAKEHGIIRLSFPRHCSHMMQPLDKNVYGPFKKFYVAAMKGSTADNKGRTLSIYDILSLVAKAMIAGFKTTGIFPHDRKQECIPSSYFLVSTNLLECLNDWTLILQDGHAVSVAYIDFNKAFDCVSHDKLFLLLYTVWHS